MGTIVITALCCVLIMCVIVQGLYQVEVKLLGYDNPTERCQRCRSLSNRLKSCCDDFERSDECRSDGRACDSYFIYCLRPFGSVDFQGGWGCSDDESMTSDVNTDDRRIDISQSEVLGLDNPFHLEGLRENLYIGVQLYIEIQDEDIGENNLWGANKPDELVDVLLIDHNKAVGMSQRHNHTGIHGFVTMDLNITVFCGENFGGPDCSQCIPGFTGNDCQINIDDCLSNPCALNGKCVDGVDSFVCNCDSGFTGPQCQTTDHCVGVNCNGNGLCVNDIDSFVCNCSAGYNGLLCDNKETTKDSVSSLSLAVGPDKIIGSVVGVILIIILVVTVTLVVVVVYILRQHRRKRRETDISKGTKQSSGQSNIPPQIGDIPVYGISEGHIHIPNMGHGVDEREFDNPIYGSDEKIDNVYASPSFKEQGPESPPDHEFDNPIYGSETDIIGSVYSLISAPLPAVYDTVTDGGLSESDKRVNDA